MSTEINWMQPDAIIAKDPYSHQTENPRTHLVLSEKPNFGKGGLEEGPVGRIWWGEAPERPRTFNKGLKSGPTPGVASPIARRAVSQRLAIQSHVLKPLRS
jgi:hypothetical protein